MNSISIRFAVAAVSVSFLIFISIGSINYVFMKQELLENTTQKVKLIEKNTIQRIQTIISNTKEKSEEIKELLSEQNYTKNAITKILKAALQSQSYFYGMAVAFEPNEIYKKAFAPYYYKSKDTILYTDLAKKAYNYLEKPWYVIPKQNNKESWSEPYFDKGGGNVLMTTYSNPIIQKDRFIGVCTIDLSLEDLKKFIASIHILKSGYAFLLSQEHKILVDPDSSKIMHIYPKKKFPYKQIVKEKDRWIYYTPISSSGLILGIVLPHNELFSSLHQISLLTTLLAVIGTILLVITIFLISRRISQPLKDLTNLTQEIASGNFQKRVVLPKIKDEVYYLSLSVNCMQNAIEQYIQDLKIATIRQQKIESELEIAKSIQMSMLPNNLQKNQHIVIEAFLQPAKAVGGDFYDYFHINERYSCFVIADVSGKGIPAALFMAVTMSYIRAYAHESKSVSQIISKLNSTMALNNDANMFVTLFFAMFDKDIKELTFVNAGHTQPYIVSEDKDIFLLSRPKNPVVGAFENIVYEQESLCLSINEKIFCYTDGVTEAYSKEDEQFGDKRLYDILQNNRTLSPKELIKKVYSSLQEFCRDAEQSDDITMLCVSLRSIE